MIQHCPECRRATRETPAGPAPVSPEELERIGPDAEVLDIRNGPAARTRRPPPKIRNFVEGRDRGLCVMPGCRNRADHFHHEKGWKEGHDPDHCFGLCGAHHRGHHKGYVVAKGSMPDLHFYRRDGVYLGRAGDEKLATEVSPEAGLAPRSAPPTGEEAPSPGSSSEETTAEASACEEGPATSATKRIAEASACEEDQVEDASFLPCETPAAKEGAPIPWTTPSRRCGV